MKTLIFLITSFLIFSVSWSQNQTGVINYGELQSMGLGAPVGADYNAILVFDNKNSLYINRQDSLENGHIYKSGNFGSGNNRVIRTVVTNKIGFRYFNNLTEKTMYYRDIGFNKVKESTENIVWTICTNTKKIGNIECTKATAAFRGRNYTAAWFAPSIALPFGPWKLQGLPGIILEAYDTDKEIYWYFKSINYPGNFKHLLKPIDNESDKWMTSNEFEKSLVLSYIESITGSRMLTKNMDFSSYSNIDKDLKKVHIEAYKVIE